MIADVVERADMGMRQRRDRPRLALETAAPLRIARDLGRQDFDGDRAAETRIARVVDLAHAARADLVAYLVWPELRAGRDGHGSYGATRSCTRT